jgi:hypothetical protein
MISNWADKLINLYFNQRPSDITQKLYKKSGYKPFEYWYYELLYILNSNWSYDEIFSDYLKNKYRANIISSANFDSLDREAILISFYKHLGIENDTTKN